MQQEYIEKSIVKVQTTYFSQNNHKKPLIITCQHLLLHLANAKFMKLANNSQIIGF